MIWILSERGRAANIAKKFNSFRIRVKTRRADIRTLISYHQSTALCKARKILYPRTICALAGLNSKGCNMKVKMLQNFEKSSQTNDIGPHKNVFDSKRFKEDAMFRLLCCHHIYLILLNNLNNLIILTNGCRYWNKFILRKERYSFHDNIYSTIFASAQSKLTVTLKRGIIFSLSQQN